MLLVERKVEVNGVGFGGGPVLPFFLFSFNPFSLADLIFLHLPPKGLFVLLRHNFRQMLILVIHIILFPNFLPVQANRMALFYFFILR